MVKTIKQNGGATLFKKLRQYKGNYNYNKQKATNAKNIPWNPANDDPNFVTNTLEIFSTFMYSMNEIQKDYPLLLEEYIWYSTLNKKDKDNITKKYKKVGLDKNMWFGPPENEIIKYEKGVYGHPSVSWRCTLKGDQPFHLSVGYSLSLQWFLFSGEEHHWINNKNACGPGTKIELRLSKYWGLLPLFINIIGAKMKGTYPWNEPQGGPTSVDACCFKHDQEYSIKGQSSKQIEMADWAMLYCIEKAKGKDLQFKDFIIKYGIKGKLTLESILANGLYGIITNKLSENDKYPENYKEFKALTDKYLSKSPIITIPPLGFSTKKSKSKSKSRSKSSSRSTRKPIRTIPPLGFSTKSRKKQWNMKRIREIESIEKKLYPEPNNRNNKMSKGNNKFSKLMATDGFKYKNKRLFHTDLPPELNFSTTTNPFSFYNTSKTNKFNKTNPFYNTSKNNKFNKTNPFYNTSKNNKFNKTNPFYKYKSSKSSKSKARSISKLSSS